MKSLSWLSPAIVLSVIVASGTADAGGRYVVRCMDPNASEISLFDWDGSPRGEVLSLNDLDAFKGMRVDLDRKSGLVKAEYKGQKIAFKRESAVVARANAKKLPTLQAKPGAAASGTNLGGASVDPCKEGGS